MHNEWEKETFIPGMADTSLSKFVEDFLLGSSLIFSLCNLNEANLNGEPRVSFNVCFSFSVVFNDNYIPLRVFIFSVSMKNQTNSVST